MTLNLNAEQREVLLGLVAREATVERNRVERMTARPAGTHKAETIAAAIDRVQTLVLIETMLAHEPCEHCGYPVVWVESLGDWRHVEPERECWLHPASDLA